MFHNSVLFEAFGETEGIKIKAVMGNLSLYRKDRKFILSFINNRRVTEYSLVHAIDYAYSKYLPGGCYPVCFLFLDISPEHLDFNIHPAKREVKFKNLPSIHHVVSQFIGENLMEKNRKQFSMHNFQLKPDARQDFFEGFSTNSKPSNDSYKNIFDNTPTVSTSESVFKKDNITTISKKIETNVDVKSYNLLYLGQLFHLFLLFEYDKKLLLIDQHAAHEKIIFNKLSNNKPQIQELLIPIELHLEKEEEYVLEKNMRIYEDMGFKMQKINPNNWLINSVPDSCNGMDDKIIDFFKNHITDEDELKKEIFAQISCKSAIKDGDRIDSVTALELATKVLNMDNPRCPHGRPIINYISIDDLFKMFGRTF